MTHLIEPPLIDRERIPVYEEIDIERDNQDRKFGANRTHKPAEWLMILGEEVGEANEAALEHHFGFAGAKGLSAYRKELIQVAAVAVAMIESLDRQEGWKAGREERLKKALEAENDVLQGGEYALEQLHEKLGVKKLGQDS